MVRVDVFDGRDRQMENEKFLLLIKIVFMYVLPVFVVAIFIQVKTNSFFIGILSGFIVLAILIFRKKIFNRRTGKPYLMVLGLILLIVVGIYLYPVIKQQIEQIRIKHLSEKEIAFITSLSKKYTYPEAPSQAEFKQLNEIDEHARSICKSHCGKQFVNQASLGYEGAELFSGAIAIDCYCSDSNSSQVNTNYFKIDAKTGNVLLHNIQE